MNTIISQDTETMEALEFLEKHSMIRPFETEEIEGVTFINYESNKKNVTSKTFIKNCLSVLNLPAIIIAEDGIVFSVNGKPISFHKERNESEFIALSEKYACNNIYKEIHAPEDFKIKTLFEKNPEELEKILIFDRRAIPSYMDVISEIESADVVISDGIMVFNTNQSDFIYFNQEWDLNTIVYYLEYDDEIGQFFDCEFSARDFIDGKVDIDFYSLEEIQKEIK